MKMYQGIYLALTLLNAAATSIKDDENMQQTAFVLYSLTVKCNSLPDNNPCNITHEVIDIGLQNQNILLDGINTTIYLLKNDNSTQQCIESARQTVCFGFVKCPSNRDQLRVNFDVAACQKSSEQAIKSCPSWVAESPAFNCSGILQEEKAVNAPVKPVCTSVPENPNSFCKLSGFKAPTMPSPDEQHVAEMPKNMVKDILESLKNMFSPECYNSVKEVVCLSSTPMCSDDETKVVSLISKQDCQEKLNCTKSTSAGSMLIGNFCSKLPNETIAEKYARPAGLIVPNWNQTSKVHRSKKMFTGLYKLLFKRSRENSNGYAII